MRSLAGTWIMFALALFGTLFPDLAAPKFLDDPGLVRWIAIPLLFASSVLLVSYYTRWF